jgi:hypothetical protein
MIGRQATATRLVPAQRILTLFDPVLHVTSPVVQLDHLPGGELGIGRDEPSPREEIPVVPLDLSGHSAFFVPSLWPAPQIDQLDLNAAFGWSSHGTGPVRGIESAQRRIGG